MIYESVRKMTYKEQEAYDLGYLNGKGAAICSPQPDPITGLVPCGCGGRPTFHHAYIAKGDKCYFECTACGARGALRLDEERARYSWNTAMGWKE